MTAQSIRNFVFAAAAAAVFTTGTAHAERHRSQPVTIPYEFHVNNVKLPAGEYRVEQDTMSEIAALINNKTGEKVLFLRPRNTRTPGKVNVKVQEGKSGLELKVS